MAGTITLQCLQTGGGAFLVDGGRPGQRALGIASGGPADPRARDAANHLLGQTTENTCLELTRVGGRWLMSGQGQFVITGAAMNWRLNGRLLEAYTVQYLEGDGLLVGTVATSSLRSYLAINGTWSVDRILGSAETGLPGIMPIRPGWRTDVVWDRESAYQTDLEVYQHVPQNPEIIPVIPGPEWPWLTPFQQKELLKAVFQVSPQSSRQGIRLTRSDHFTAALPSLISSPVLPGTIQLTPSGLILLGPEAQTVGGYPRVLLHATPATLGSAFQVPVGGNVKLRLSQSA